MIVYKRRVKTKQCSGTDNIVENQAPGVRFTTVLSDCLTVRSKSICSSRTRREAATDTNRAHNLAAESKFSNRNSSAYMPLRYDENKKETTAIFSSSTETRYSRRQNEYNAKIATTPTRVSTVKSEEAPVRGPECEFSYVNISNDSRPVSVKATLPVGKIATAYNRVSRIWKSQCRQQRTIPVTKEAEIICNSRIVPARRSFGARPSTTPIQGACKESYKLCAHSGAGRPQTTPVNTSSRLVDYIVRDRTRVAQSDRLDTRIKRGGNCIERSNLANLNDIFRFRLDKAKFDVSDISFPELVSKLENNVMQANFPSFFATLISFNVASRQKVINYKAEYPTATSIFFTACQLSRIQFVEFMLKECSPDLEQTALSTLPLESASHRISPLWHAAATGNLEMVRLLAKHNADVNTTSSSGTTAVMAACSSGHLEIVSLLVTRGADVHAKNVNGFTCLMGAVQAPKLIQFLVRLGARVSETDKSGNTALHYAAEVGSIEAVARLVDMGANPMAVNNDNLNVIQTAAKFRHRSVLEYLLNVTRPKITEIIDAYLIIGAMTILLDSDYSNGLHQWEKALALGKINTNDVIYYSMRDSLLARCFHIKELTCLDSISRCPSDHDALCIQALLVYERNRGQHNESYINLLMYRGAVSADEEKFLMAINLWKTAYRLHLQKIDSSGVNFVCDVFSRNVMRSVEFLVKVFHHVHGLGNSREMRDACMVPESVARELLDLITDHITKAIRRYSCSPKCEQFYFLLKCSLCVFLLYLETYDVQDRRPELGVILQKLISLKPRGETNETLLHMCLDVKTLDPLECDLSAVLGNHWPSQAMLEILILLGADPVAKDFFGNTILHAAVTLHNCGVAVEPGVVTMLLRRGAHADQVNDHGLTAADLLCCNESLRQTLQTTSLKCLAAKVIASNRIQFVGEVPRNLYQFIELHGG